MAQHSFTDMLLLYTEDNVFYLDYQFLVCINVS